MTIRGASTARSIRGPARLAWLVIVAVTVAAPAAVLAATPPGTTGGPDTEPDISLLSRLIDVAAPLAVIAVALVILIALGFFVARIGRSASARASGSGPPVSTGFRWASWTMSVLVASGSLIIGVLVGRAIASEESRGGLGGALGAGFLTVGIIAMVVGLAAVGVIATVFRRGHISRAIWTMLAGACLIAAGAIGGRATAGPLDGTYHEPVVLEAAGQARLELRADNLPFVPDDHGGAACRSVPDGRGVAAVTALGLGELGSGTLRGTLTLSAEAPNVAAAEFWIDGADLAESSNQPFWLGSAHITEIGADAASGKAAFSGLEQLHDKESSAQVTTASSWPAMLSGALLWSCQPW